MAKLPHDFGEGGSYLTSGDSAGKPSLKTLLSDIITDLHTLNNTSSGVATPVTAPALAAFSDPPTASQMEALRTLVNQMRAHLTSGGSAGSGGGLLSTL